MAQGAREESKRRRVGARERRRSLASEPFEALDEAAGGDDQKDDSLATFKKAARTAAAAAVAGGLTGGVKALLDRRGRAQEADRHEDAQADEEPTQAASDASEENHPGDESASAGSEAAVQP